MANKDAAFGCKPVRMMGGAPYSGGQSRYRIASGVTTPLFQGDLVTQLTAGVLGRHVATGTVPIYYGSPSIVEKFNPEGIIMLDENFNIDDLSADLYHSKMEAIKDNFDRVQNHVGSDDILYQNITANLGAAV